MSKTQKTRGTVTVSVFISLCSISHVYPILVCCLFMRYGREKLSILSTILTLLLARHRYCTKDELRSYNSLSDYPYTSVL